MLNSTKSSVHNAITEEKTPEQKWTTEKGKWYFIANNFEGRTFYMDWTLELIELSDNLIAKKCTSLRN